VNKISFSLFDLEDEDIAEYLKLIEEYRPTWIFGSPSGVINIARYIKKYDVSSPASIKYIELSGEYATNETICYIREAFNTQVSSMYGMRECYGIAMLCPKGKMHCLDENVYVEILDNEFQSAEEGEIYITTLNNSVMPMIRYATGDKGKWVHPSVCECGNSAPTLEVLSGRSSSFISMGNGKKYTKVLFS